MSASTRHRKSFRLSDEANKLLRRLSQKFGISETSVIEIAIRQMAEGNNLFAPSTPDNPPTSPHHS